MTAKPFGQNTFPGTDAVLSSIGIGTWAWGDKLLWKYGDGYSEKDIFEAFKLSVEAGVNLFDTASVYGMGKSEKFLGEFINLSNASVHVATKYFPYPWHISPRKAVVNSLKRSLKRLKLDYVDLYQVHWPTPLTSPRVFAEGLADAVDAGLTRAVGVSNFNIAQMQETYDTLAVRGIPLASNQVEYSLLYRKPERSGLLARCHDLGVTFIAYSPLSKGILTGKYTPASPPPGVRSRSYSVERLTELKPLLELMSHIGTKYGNKTIAQVALNWVITKGALPIPGAKNKRQAEENTGSMNWNLSDEDVNALDALSDRFT